MPQFTFEARDLNGKHHKGNIAAMNKIIAMEELKKRGMIVHSLKEKRETILNKEIYLGNPVKLQHFVIYCRQFATLIRAGVTIVDATRILSEQTESKALKKALVAVAAELRKGNAFSQAIQDHKHIFPPLFINMIRAGEETGKIDETLEQLATYFEKSHYTKEKVKSAMTYPVVVGIISVVVVTYLLKFVVPRFVSMFEEMNVELPAITSFVISLSKSVEHQWYLWLGGIILLVLFFQIFRKMEKGRFIIDLVKLKIPVFGKLNQKSAIAQLTRTLASLYGSSVPVLQSLSIVENVVGNKVIGGVIREAQESLRQGKSLSEPLKKSWVFPPLVTQMIAIGEETGSLDQMLLKVADFYEKDVDNTVDKLKSLLEPLLILFLAGVVGVIVAAIMMPMFSLYENVGNM